MPWKETCVMDEKVKFIADYLDEGYTMSELCQYYGISRKTGYKWLQRYETDGIEGLRTLSSTPPPPADHRCLDPGTDHPDKAGASKLWSEKGDGLLTARAATVPMAGG